ncbi:MAG: hypothetical protein V5A56_12620 [Halolamina sp.]
MGGKRRRTIGQYGDIDYPTYTKRGVRLGQTLLVAGELGGYASQSVSLPAWEEAPFFDLAVIGLLVFVRRALLFGLVLPLTE